MVFWTNVCCWFINLRKACTIIAIYLIITETTLFIVSFVAGDEQFIIENGFYSYPANMMYFPIPAFAVQIIACLCLAASAIWQKIGFATVWAAYQILELVVFIIMVCDQVLGDNETPDELTLTVRGGAKFYVIQIGTVLLKIYFLYIVASWVKELKIANELAREEARTARSQARAARRAQLAAKTGRQT